MTGHDGLRITALLSISMFVSTILEDSTDRQLGLAVVWARNHKQSNREKRVKINKGFTVHSAIRSIWLPRVSIPRRSLGLGL